MYILVPTEWHPRPISTVTELELTLMSAQKASLASIPTTEAMNSSMLCNLYGLCF